MTTIRPLQDIVKRIGASKASHFGEMWRWRCGTVVPMLESSCQAQTEEQDNMILKQVRLCVSFGVLTEAMAVVVYEYSILRRVAFHGVDTI